ncbi:MAG: phosphate signaling complex protein PhoU [Anaerolineae bacterium]|jgi:phosphate transport system protein|nr:phosphate signaling complex protein PhoU [Anaerolineae bacterium]MDX9830202.1 phosphate signaling complex protein PhoU [Anaerolineae bacterium]
MVRQTFDEQLADLQGMVMDLGRMVGDALVESVDQLKRRDFDGSRRLIEQDHTVNATRFAIESQALTLIATQQPMARDMRLLAAILDIASELERIGDYAKGIARINIAIGEQPLMKPLIDLPVMADKARAMFDAALEAFRDRDIERARAIPAKDDEVDALYQSIYRELVSFIVRDPDTIEQANLLMWAAHNLERAADRVTNLCERVVYTVTGVLEELDSDTANIESMT